MGTIAQKYRGGHRLDGASISATMPSPVEASRGGAVGRITPRDASGPSRLDRELGIREELAQGISPLRKIPRQGEPCQFAVDLVVLVDDGVAVRHGESPNDDPSQKHRLTADVVIQAGLQPAVFDEVDMSTENRFEQPLEPD